MVLDHLVKEKPVHFSNKGQKRVGGFYIIAGFFLVLKSSAGALILINYKVLLHHFLCPLSAYLFQIECELQSLERKMLRKILFQFIVTSTGCGVKYSF